MLGSRTRRAVAPCGAVGAIWMFWIVGGLMAFATAAAAAVPEVEPNDSALTAQDVTGAIPLSASFPPDGGGVLLTGALAPGDVDYFSFAVQAGEFISVEVASGESGEFHDSLVRLEGAGFSVSDDDDGAGFLSALGYRAPASETLTVAVSGFGDSDFDGIGNDEAFAYRLVLSVTTQPPSRTETEANDTAAAANPVPLGTPFLSVAPGGVAVAAADLQVGDVDYFEVDLDQPGQLTVGVFDETGGDFNDPVIQLIPPGLAPVSDDDSGPGFLATLDQPVTGAGIWTLAVGGFGDSSFDGSSHTESFPYQLVVSYDGVATPVDYCDVNDDDAIDSLDIAIITDAIGQTATGPTDPRDVDGDGTITVLDARGCTFQCDHADCAVEAPSTRCGLLGIEPALLLPFLLRRRLRSLRQGQRSDRRTKELSC